MYYICYFGEVHTHYLVNDVLDIHQESWNSLMILRFNMAI